MGGVLMAFENYRPKLGVFGSEWVGLENIVAIFTQTKFTTAILNSDAQMVENNEHEGFDCCKTAGSAKGEDGNFYFLVRDMYDSYWGTANCSGIVGMDSNGKEHKNCRKY